MKYIATNITLRYLPENCTGCRRCTEVCPHEVFAMDGKKASVVNREACIECGACMRNCAFNAIIVNAGVGCATAMIDGLLRYGDVDKGTCDCAPSGGGCC